MIDQQGVMGVDGSSAMLILVIPYAAAVFVANN